MIVFSAISARPQDTVVYEKPDPIGVLGFRLMPIVSAMNLQNQDGPVEGEFTWGLGSSSFAGYNFNQNIGLELNIIYNHLILDYRDHQLLRKIELDYVDIPFLLSMNKGKTDRVNFSAVLGPQIGFNVGSEFTSNGSTNGVEHSSAIFAIKKSNFGIAYGAGIDVGLNLLRTVKLELGFRGVLGLTDISDRRVAIQPNQYFALREGGGLRTYSGYVGLMFLF